MDNKTIAFMMLEAVALLLSLLVQQLMLFPIAVAAAGYLYGRKKPKTDYHLLSFTREFCNLCSDLGVAAALHRACLLPSAPSEIVNLERRIRAGELESESNSIADQDVRELSSLIILGVCDGKDIRKNLSMFMSRLEDQMEARNRIIQSSLNLETLSSIGIILFIPFFGGIGTSIIGASGIITGNNLAAAKESFELAIIAYVAVMCYVTGVFKSGSSMQYRIASSIQGVAIGASLMRITALFVSYAI